MTGYNDSRDETLKAIEETINLPNNKTVRPGSPAERLCKRLISVVMCTFALEPPHALVMRAFCDFPERYHIKPSQLSKKMQIDLKSVSIILKQLKAGGYILETSFAESFAKRGRSSHMKTVRYHIDFSYFIDMIHLRLHEIIGRLSLKQEENDANTAIGSFVCVNEACKEYMTAFNTLDLMQNSGKNSVIDSKTGKLIFICDMCHEELMDESEKFRDESGNNLDIKRAFNQQSMPLTKLLAEVEIAVKHERASMQNEQRRAEEEKEMLESGYGELAYKVANLNFGKKKRGAKAADESQRTLDHLSKLGGRRRKIDTSKFLFKPEEIVDVPVTKRGAPKNDNANKDNNDESKNGDNAEGKKDDVDGNNDNNNDEEDSDSDSDEEEDIDILQANWVDSRRIYNASSIEMKQAIHKNFEKMKKDGENHFKTLKHANDQKKDKTSSNSNGNVNIEVNNNGGDAPSVNVNVFFDEVKSFDTSTIFVKVQGEDVSLKKIFKHSDLYEDKMTEDEYLVYDSKIVELGLTSIE